MTQRDLDRFRTMPAFRLDRDRQRGVAKSPLHEGRRDCVNRSGGVQFFSRIKGGLMGSLSDGHGIGPRDFPLFVSVQKG